MPTRPRFQSSFLSLVCDWNMLAEILSLRLPRLGDLPPGPLMTPRGLLVGYLLLMGCAHGVLPSAAIPSSPCRESPLETWTAMSEQDAPELGDAFDARSGFLSSHRWWLWNAYGPLEESRVFDADCNRWLKPSTPETIAMPAGWDRRVLVAVRPGAAWVMGPSWERTPTQMVAGPFRVLVLDSRELRWSELGALRELGRETSVLLGDEHVVLHTEGGSGVVLDLVTREAEAFESPTPLLGRGYDCSWIVGSAWLVANATGVFRFDFDPETWTTLFRLDPPMATTELGACVLSSQADDSWIATTKSLYNFTRQASFVISAGGHAATRFDPAARAPASREVAVAAPALDGFALHAESNSVSLAWGRVETRGGHNCQNPFHPTRRDPQDPICTPSHGVEHRRAMLGGRFFRRLD